MSDLYPGAFSPQSHEAYSVWGLEAGALALDVNTPGAVPSLALFGYGDVPSSNKPENPTPINAQGIRGAASFLPGLRAPVVTQPLILSGGAQAKKFLQAGFVSTPIGVIPADNRFMCLPIFAFGYGLIGACDPNRSYNELWRYCMINSGTIDISPGQPARVSLEIWALFVNEYATVTLPTISPTTVAAAAGEEFGWQHFYFDVTDSGGATYDYSTHLQSLQIQWSNNLSRSGQRREQTGGDSNAVSRAAGSIDVGDFNASIQMGFKKPVPPPLSMGGARSTRWSDVTAKLSNGTNTINITAAKAVLDSRGQSGQGRGAINYSASVQTTNLVVT